MLSLAPCPRCRRHCEPSTSCPFCAAELPRPEPTTALLGRWSRAMVFASATLATAAACGGKHKKPHGGEGPEEHYQNHPCSGPNEAEVKRLEEAKAQAQTDEEKQAIENQLQQARMPVCAPYGAPPARRRIV